MPEAAMVNWADLATRLAKQQLQKEGAPCRLATEDADAAED